MWTRIFALISVLAVCLAAAGCGLGDSCTADTWRCGGSELQYCTTHPSGPTGSYEDPQWDKGSSPTWELVAQCRPGACISTSSGKTCTFEQKRNPACPAGATAFACDGNTALHCADGYVVERKLCRVCDAKQSACDGGYDSGCQVDADCAAGLTCQNNYCEMACTCPDGVACPTCDVLETDAPSETNNPPAWKCYMGQCMPH